jgi:5-methyltetrahydropteroyltriglutamate--homocysteine methyltransferase
MPSVYRAEVVGSLLRPAYLLEARKKIGALRFGVRHEREPGGLSLLEFKRLEDRAVEEAIAIQQKVGLDVVTDGELRRAVWADAIFFGLEGLSPIRSVSYRWKGKAEDARITVKWPSTVTGKLRRGRSPMIEEFVYARSKTSKPLKVTIASPLQLGCCYSSAHSSEAYPDPWNMFEDACAIVHQDVLELASLGCEYMQMDAPELATLVDPEVRADFWDKNLGEKASERMLTKGVDLLNQIADVPGVKWSFHLCRGNGPEFWMAEGGYQSISKQVFKRATRYDTFLLEYDDWRSGSFEPLADVPKDKYVVLGLISTKNLKMESADEIVDKLKQASRYFPLEQLGLSTQCGFASAAESHSNVGLAVQEAKLRLVVEVARRVWR